MATDLIAVEIKGIVPTPGGSGVFVSAEDKVITLFIDPAVSGVLAMSLQGEAPPRPLTHSLLASVLLGLGVTLQRVVIHDLREEIFYARLHLAQENELGRSYLEIDARPSDGMVLATLLSAPVYVARTVWDAVEDMSWAMRQLRESQESEGQSGD